MLERHKGQKGAPFLNNFALCTYNNTKYWPDANVKYCVDIM